MKEFDYDSIKMAGLNLTKIDNDFNTRKANISLWIREVQQMAKKTFIEDEYIKQIETLHDNFVTSINKNIIKYNEAIEKEGPYFGSYLGTKESAKILNSLNSQLNEYVFNILEQCSIIDANSVKKQTLKTTNDKKEQSLTINENVFIVHGHNTEIKQIVARTLSTLKFNPIILHESPDSGNTLMEKLEENSNQASYAIVILTSDDLGKAKNSNSLQPRARQNVILELGFFIGKLGRKRVFVLKQDDLELPSDISGIVYNNYDGEEGGWKSKLVKNMKAIGFDVDANNL